MKIRTWPLIGSWPMTRRGVSSNLAPILEQFMPSLFHSGGSRIFTEKRRAQISSEHVWMRFSVRARAREREREMYHPRVPPPLFLSSPNFPILPDGLKILLRASDIGWTPRIYISSAHVHFLSPRVSRNSSSGYRWGYWPTYARIE